MAAAALCVAVVALAGACGGEAEDRTLTLGYLEWDENVAVSNLTKVLLEEELGYDKVELKKTDLGPIFDEVATGEVDGFQDVWLPNHDERRSRARLSGSAVGTMGRPSTVSRCRVTWRT